MKTKLKKAIKQFNEEYHIDTDDLYTIDETEVDQFLSWAITNKKGDFRSVYYKMKKFKVTAKCITYCDIIIEAKDKDEANDIACYTDGGDFTPTERGDEWEVQDGLTIEIKQKRKNK